MVAVASSSAGSVAAGDSAGAQNGTSSTTSAEDDVSDASTLQETAATAAAAAAAAATTAAASAVLGGLLIDLGWAEPGSCFGVFLSAPAAVVDLGLLFSVSFGFGVAAVPSFLTDLEIALVFSLASVFASEVLVEAGVEEEVAFGLASVALGFITLTGFTLSLVTLLSAGLSALTLGRASFVSGSFWIFDFSVGSFTALTSFVT